MTGKTVDRVHCTRCAATRTPWGEVCSNRRQAVHTACGAVAP